jgi:hypothetical protein
MNVRVGPRGRMHAAARAKGRLVALLPLLILLPCLLGGCTRGELLVGRTEFEKDGWEPYDVQETVGVITYWPITAYEDPESRRTAVEFGLIGSYADESFAFNSPVQGPIDIEGPVVFGEALIGMEYRYNVYPDSIFRPYWSWGGSVTGAGHDLDFESKSRSHHGRQGDAGLGLYVRVGLEIQLGPVALDLGGRYRTTTTMSLNSPDSEFRMRAKATAFQYFLGIRFQRRPSEAAAPPEN